MAVSEQAEGLQAGLTGPLARELEVAIKLARAAGAAAVGVVYLPDTDVLYYAARGHGAWVVRRETGAESVRVSREVKLPRLRLAVSRNHRSPKMDTVVRAFGFKEQVARGSVGIKIGLIVERQCDLYIHLSPRTKQWDTCAPEAILA